MNGKMSEEERDLLERFERDELPPAPDVDREIEEARRAARITFNKTKRVNLRVTERDFTLAHLRAREEGIPYQTLLSGVIHKYLSGRLVERRFEDIRADILALERETKGLWAEIVGMAKGTNGEGTAVTERPSLDIEWLLERGASSDEVAALTQIAIEEGLPGPVRPALSQKSIGEMPWMVLILTPVIPFLKGFFEEAGRTAYQDLRRLMTRLLAVRQEGQGHVEVREKDSLKATVIVFARDLPEEAFKQLAELDLEYIEGKYWVWDRKQRCWISQSMDGE